METTATAPATPALPYFVGHSQNKDVYRSAEHLAILDQNYQIVADIEGDLSPEAEATAGFIALACNAYEGLLAMARQYSADCETRISILNDEIISDDDPDIDDLEDQIGHWTATKKQVDAVIARATPTEHGEAA